MLAKRSTRANSETGTSVNARDSLSAKSVDSNSRKKSKEPRKHKYHADDQEEVARFGRNLGDSDDSSDEEVLLRTGNVPMKWYELYDH